MYKSTLINAGLIVACHVVTLLCAGLLSAPSLAQAGALKFISVDLSAGEQTADKALMENLDPKVVSGEFKPMDYSHVVIEALKPNANFIARLTPYAYVAAELQGAKLHIIATYISRSTQSTVYQSNFVVRPEEFPAGPSTADLVKTLRTASKDGDPYRFIYHKRLSTSSYFLPSLFFRSERIFSGTAIDEGIDEKPITIKSEQYSAPDSAPSSSELVCEVARSPRTFAAVWDGTRSKFDPERASGRCAVEGSDVLFVKLPFELPNDLLVSTTEFDTETLDLIHSDLGLSIDFGDDTDVTRWVPWENDEAKAARFALSSLRRAASTPPAPVVVLVQRAGAEAAEGTEEWDEEKLQKEAVRQAIRLSSTELVAWDKTYVQHNVDWTLETIHDGALRLTAVYRGFNDDKSDVMQKCPDDIAEVCQRFEISYINEQDLTHRVGTLIHSRMHRIRPVWLYQDVTPMVIRDVAFEVAKDLRLPYQKIEWTNLESNNFQFKSVLNTSQQVAVLKTDFSKFELDAAPFPAKSDKSKLDFDPMGRLEHRVLLLRPTTERTLFKALTAILLVLFTLAFAGVLWDLRRMAAQDD